MEAIIFIGIQATGKSTFYKSRFLHTHVHINLDKLRTRHREAIFMSACFSTQMAFAVDNTNPGVEDRKRYIKPALKSGYKVIGYYFQSRLSDSSNRNAEREVSVPEIALRSTYSKLELPSYSEGYDELWYVQIDESDFTVKAWQDEI